MVKKKYIDAEDLMLRISKIRKIITPHGFNASLDAVIKEVQSMPCANVRQNVYAKKTIHADGKSHWFICSQCLNSVDMEDKYCRHCGYDFQEPDREIENV